MHIVGSPPRHQHQQPGEPVYHPHQQPQRRDDAAPGATRDSFNEALTELALEMEAELNVDGSEVENGARGRGGGWGGSSGAARSGVRGGGSGGEASADDLDAAYRFEPFPVWPGGHCSPQTSDAI
jgi:hypothetical protein